MTVFSRKWAMPNHDTFSVGPIAQFVGRYIKPGQVWIDPFARNSPFKRFCAATNDLNPDFETTHHLEALDFISLFAPNSCDGVIFDPPYSPRQISECYAAVGRKAHTEDTQSSFYGNRKNAISNIVRSGGHVLSFGWNTNGIGEGRGFEIVEVLLVAHGGAHNDTICVAERKKHDLFSEVMG